MPTLFFDKKVTYQTLGQDAGSFVKNYVLQKNVIFRGRASVKSGRHHEAIALFTTVRAVYASSNEKLTRAAIDTSFFKFNNQIPTLGEVMRITKNKVGIPSNSRKFTLLGDPSMQLALPNYKAATSKINGSSCFIIW